MERYNRKLEREAEKTVAEQERRKRELEKSRKEMVEMKERMVEMQEMMEEMRSNKERGRAKVESTTIELEKSEEGSSSASLQDVRAESKGKGEKQRRLKKGAVVRRRTRQYTEITEDGKVVPAYEHGRKKEELDLGDHTL